MKGSVAVITGGAGGIGTALAVELGSFGVRVVLCDVSAEALEQSVTGLTSAGIDAAGVVCDVTDPDVCASTVDEINLKFGGIDILCNNAGITQISRFADTEDVIYRRIMDINFFGAVNMTRAALPTLKERNGIIVVTSSIAGFAPLLGRTGYCASKHALHGFFNALRIELKDDGVDVLMVCPCFTKTSIKNIGTDSSSRAIRGRQANPKDVARSMRKAIVGRKRIAVLSLKGKIAWYTYMIMPRFYERLMVKTVTRH